MNSLGSAEESVQYSHLEDRILRFIQGQSEESFETLIFEVHVFQATYDPVIAPLSKLSPKSWQAIPAIPQEAFKEFRIATFPESASMRVFYTSGTTTAGTGKHWFRSLTLYEQAVCEGWHRAGLAGIPIIALLPHPSSAPHSSLAQMATWLTPEKNFVLDKPERIPEMIGDSPVIIFGTALAFLDYFERFPPLKLPAGSLAVETGGYKGSQRTISKADLYQLFERHFGLNAACVVNEYGMTELSSQFYARGVRTPHQTPPWARALVIDPETNRECSVGRTGLLRLFDLANLGSACVIQTRDLAIRREEGFELLGRDPAALPRGCSLTGDVTQKEKLVGQNGFFAPRAPKSA